MSPRPRSIADTDLLEAAARVIARRGMARLTLADVAAELGISPGTLGHRFGSRRGLLLALMRRSVGRAAERVKAARAGGGSPLAGLLALADRMARYATTPEALAHHLEFLHGNQADPEFHRLTSDHARRIRREMASRIRGAMEAGELEPGDPDVLARALQATLNGTLVQWTIERRGALASLLRANLRAVLRPVETRQDRA